MIEAIDEAVEYINSISKPLARYVKSILLWDDESRTAYLLAYRLLNEDEKEEENEPLVRKRNTKSKKRDAPKTKQKKNSLSGRNV